LNDIEGKILYGSFLMSWMPSNGRPLEEEEDILWI
jgi:hypothetical protein